MINNDFKRRVRPKRSMSQVFDDEVSSEYFKYFSFDNTHSVSVTNTNFEKNHDDFANKNFHTSDINELLELNIF
jgi:hypothetical protein